MKLKLKLTYKDNREIELDSRQYYSLKCSSDGNFFLEMVLSEEEYGYYGEDFKLTREEFEKIYNFMSFQKEKPKNNSKKSIFSSFKALKDRW